MRLAVLCAIVAAGFYLVETYLQSREEVNAERTKLLAEFDAAAKLANAGKVVEKARRYVERAASEEGTEVIAPRLRSKAGLEQTLHRPLVFVRGPISAFTRPPSTTVPQPSVDTFVPCLIHPPRAKTEGAMLDRLDLSEREARNPKGGTNRLSDVERARAFIASSWRKEVKQADTMEQLRLLRADLKRAALERGVAASRAEVLVYLLDEPTESGSPIEFDGESPHRIRVGIVDLKNGRTLLRLRQRVDPKWISDKRRVYFARGLDTCRLALQVRDALFGKAADGKQ